MFFPHELRLRFHHAGFAVEAVFGDYHFGPLRSHSRVIVMIGRRPR